ncbi:MAG: uroporphyrinogen-III synthase [Gammaproteobacteria bacterium]|jgi:uroporphyrinogen-III synthase
MKDLKGANILVTRPKDQSENLCRLINKSGGNAVEFPTIEIVLCDDLAADTINKLLIDSSHLIFISRNAVRCINKLNVDMSRLMQDKSVYAIGYGTATELLNIGVNHLGYPSNNYGSEALLEIEGLKEPDICNKNILIIRGGEGRELLKEVLQGRGAKVQYASIYSSIMPVVSRERIDSIWKDLIPDIIVITSNQGLSNLIEMTGNKYKEILFSRRLVVMSSRIANTAINSGFALLPKVAEDQSDDGIMSAIVQCVE